MAVDLSDFVDDLKAEVNPPGSNFFPDATDDQWFQQLRDSFWEAYLDGFIQNWTEADGLVTPKTGTTDISRDFIQLIVFYAGFRVLRASIRNTQSLFRAKAGPVEFEVQQSATMMRDLLAELQQKRALLLSRLSDLGVLPVAYIDAVQSRTTSVVQGDIWWTNGTSWETNGRY